MGKVKVELKNFKNWFEKRHIVTFIRDGNKRIGKDGNSAIVIFDGKIILETKNLAEAVNKFNNTSDSPEIVVKKMKKRAPVMYSIAQFISNNPGITFKGIIQGLFHGINSKGNIDSIYRAEKFGYIKADRNLKPMKYYLNPKYQNGFNDSQIIKFNNNEQ